jgi:hypothetical protein
MAGGQVTEQKNVISEAKAFGLPPNHSFTGWESRYPGRRHQMHIFFLLIRHLHESRGLMFS